VLRKILDSPWLYFGLAALVLVVAVVSQFRLDLPSRPVGSVTDLDRLRERGDVNVVFFLIDTLRADHLSCYGHERETTPVIDFLAGTGVRFAHVQAQSSWTKVSMASLWTGSYPRRTGIQRFQDALAPEATLPAEIFKAAGFRTAGIFRNGWLANNFGFAQGYDLYVQPRPSATPAKFERKSPSAHALQGTDWDATESAVEFIRSHKHERFFLYVHYMDVHQYLYDIDSAKFGNGIRDAYDNALHWTDRNLSAVLGEIEGSDLFDRTLVVIAADHGESFYEHGMEGHARNLYREVTETPFILVLPFRLEPGLVVETPVQNVDVWPTVLDLLGLPGLPGADGRSLVPLLHAAANGAAVPEELARRSSFAEPRCAMQATRSAFARMTPIYSHGTAMGSGRTSSAICSTTQGSGYTATSCWRRLPVRLSGRRGSTPRYSWRAARSHRRRRAPGPTGQLTARARSRAPGVAARRSGRRSSAPGRRPARAAPRGASRSRRARGPSGP